MKSQALKLYDYHVWANQRVFEHIKSLPPDIYNKEIQSVFSSISEVATHIYTTDTIWLRVMSGDSFDEITKSSLQIRESTKGKSMDEMQRLFFNLSERYKAFFDRQVNLDQSIFPEHPAFGRLETNLYELVQHVVNHGTYHRGNITAMLRQLGHPGIMTDYIVYLFAINSKK